MHYNEFEHYVNSGLLSLDRPYWIAKYGRNGIVGLEPEVDIRPTEVNVFRSDEHESVVNKFQEPDFESSSAFFFKRLFRNPEITLTKFIFPYGTKSQLGVEVFNTKEAAEAFYLGKCHETLKEISNARISFEEKFGELENSLIDFVQRKESVS